MFSTPQMQGTNTISSVPAPIGGLNARDSLVAMEPTDAIVMRNWWPQPYGCSVRKGYQLWTTGLGATVHSLATLALADGTQNLYAWAGTNFYNITTAELTSPAATVSGLTDAPWQSVQMTNSAGAHLIALNGFDDAIHATSSGVARITAGDGIVANTWAGVDPQNCVQATVHQSRLWVVEIDTANGWFLPPDAVQGTFQKVDFGPNFSRGGFLLFLATWTIDDGNGAEDHLVALSSQGEAVVFAGTDPTDDTKWGLKGVYYLGQPVSGRRTYTKVGGDLVILTQQGAVSMAETLISTKVESAASKLKSDKIQYLLAELTSTNATIFGWQTLYAAPINMLLMNVPSLASSGNIQLASNQLINSWAEFTGMDAASWVVHEDLPYFGDYDGNVYVAWYGNIDDAGFGSVGGDGISAEVQQAYTYFKSAAQQKQVGMYRPIFVAAVPSTFQSNIVYDFQNTAYTIPDSAALGDVSTWDNSNWNTSNWGGGLTVQRNWVQALGMGSAVSLQMSLRPINETLWVSTDYSHITGWSVF